jgi:hypothetical protein
VSGRLHAEKTALRAGSYGGLQERADPRSLEAIPFKKMAGQMDSRAVVARDFGVTESKETGGIVVEDVALLRF